MTTTKETQSAEFKAISPRGKTPNVDGIVVIESLAILQYLEGGEARVSRL
jgi:glutathione S-transferase